MRERITRRWLVAAIAILLALTGGSWMLTHVSLGGWATPVALAISTVKVSIIATVFMELGQEAGSLRLVALVIPLWFLMMILLMVMDVASR